MGKQLNNDEHPFIVIEGMENVIEKDLGKHKAILEQTKVELSVFRQGVSHEVKKKKYYKSLIGGGKYNDESLKTAIGQININIRHMSDKVKLAQEKVEHETLIVDTLTKQLEDQMDGVRKLAEYRMKQAVKDAINDRLDESVN
jgi:hypothetical protein